MKYLIILSFSTLLIVFCYNQGYEKALRDKQIEKIKDSTAISLEKAKIQFKLDSLHTKHSCWSDKRTKRFPVKDTSVLVSDEEYRQDIERFISLNNK
jgi:hypothetical protein